MKWPHERMARWVWGAMLWTMRRPALRRVRRGWLSVLPVGLREPARRSLVRQDRFALRIGYRLLTVVFGLFLVSLLLQATYAVVVALAERGALTVPEER